METSKRIIWISYIAEGILCAIICVGRCLGLETTDIVPLAIAGYAEVAASNAFYFWKAKNENRYKYAEDLVERMADKYGIESVVQIAEAVLKE